MLGAHFTRTKQIRFRRNWTNIVWISLFFFLFCLYSSNSGEESLKFLFLTKRCKSSKIWMKKREIRLILVSEISINFLSLLAQLLCWINTVDRGRERGRGREGERVTKRELCNFIKIIRVITMQPIRIGKAESCESVVAWVSRIMRLLLLPLLLMQLMMMMRLGLSRRMNITWLRAERCAAEQFKFTTAGLCNYTCRLLVDSGWLIVVDVARININSGNWSSSQLQKRKGKQSDVAQRLQSAMFAARAYLLDPPDSVNWKARLCQWQLEQSEQEEKEKGKQ